MKISFYTPSYTSCPDFGGATYGFVTSEDEKQPAMTSFSEDIEGKLVFGSYDECLAALPEGNFKAAIVLLGNAGKENEFIHKLREKLDIPLCGGGAAIDPVSGAKGLIYGGKEAAVFLISDERYDVSLSFENIHHDILGEHKISFTNPRVIDEIDGCDPVEWLHDKKTGLGLSENDFEHLTFSDKNGVNAHLSLVDDKICSGRDLANDMLLRYVSPDDVDNRMRAFYNDGDAIVFGCAGLKGILHEKLASEGIGLFMFGEICSNEQMSEFGNLMLSKIVMKKKVI
ncbi:MAG: hypothetical protein IKL81_00190 [Clostridia bacterium]|nr:hypothetical protein [Clostridia bacterium]